MFFSGAGMHEHPRSYEIILHFWLRWTGGNFDYLRVPSVLFFLAGLFLLGRASRHFAGSSSAGIAVIWVGVLWPFGFHFGRLAAWYFVFVFLGRWFDALLFQVSGGPERSAVGRYYFSFGACLIWTSYFGWAILACLAIDQFLRWRAKEPAATPKVLLGTAALLCVSFLPLFSAFRSSLSGGMNFHQGALTILANAAFHVFSLFVSESVAPWYWWVSVPAGLAVLLCVAIGRVVASASRAAILVLQRLPDCRDGR